MTRIRTMLRCRDRVTVSESLFTFRQFRFPSLEDSTLLSGTHPFLEMDSEPRSGQSMASTPLMRAHGITRIIADCFDSVMSVTRSVASCNDSSEYDCAFFSYRVYQIERQLNSLAIPADANPQLLLTHDHVQESCRLGLLIYIYLIIRELPCTASMFEHMVGRLRASLEHINLSAWSGPLSRLLLWILFTGCAAASYTPHKPWFVSRISRLCISAHLTRWREIKNVLVGIVWLESACEQICKPVWVDVMEETLSIGLEGDFPLFKHDILCTN